LDFNSPRIFGANAIVTSSSQPKLHKAKSLGGSAVIDYHRTPEWHSEVLVLTHGRGIDHILEVVGATLRSLWNQYG